MGVAVKWSPLVWNDRPPAPAGKVHFWLVPTVASSINDVRARGGKGGSQGKADIVR